MKDTVKSAPCDSALTLKDAMLSRRSIRAFLPTDIAPEQMDELLRLAGAAPSGSNIQPWQVHVVSGAARDRLSAALLAAHYANETPTREYPYYPLEWRSPYIERRRATGWGLYSLLGIKKGDHEASTRQIARNYEFFDAPVVLMFTIDRDMQMGSWLDYGMFLQNIMLAARALGLHTCPQAALANYPAIVKQHLGIDDSKVVMCGMSIGYADPADPVNEYQPARLPLNEYVTHHRD